MITLKTLPQATEQEVFDQVVKHLQIQNEKSGDDFKCLYKTPDGLKCAAGCLIADDEYRPTMEGNSWEFLLKESIVPITHSSLIQRLQKVHDYCEVIEWKEKLQNMAIDLNLEFNWKDSDF